MFDNIKLVSLMSPPTEVLKAKKYIFDYRGILLEKRRNYEYYVGEYKGLRIRWYEKRIVIQNSIHKAYHKNNCSDFYYSEIINSLNDVASFFELDLSLTKVTKLEFGLNITLEYEVSRFLKSVISLKTKKFLPMLTNRTREYGKKAYRSQYSFKLYDKAFEAGEYDRINTNLMRIELEMVKSQYFPFITSAMDLLNKEYINQIFIKFIHLYDEIIFKPNIDSLHGVKSRNIKTFYAGNNPDYWEALKLHGESALKKGREEYRKVQSLITQDNNHPKQIREKLIEKFNILLTG